LLCFFVAYSGYPRVRNLSGKMRVKSAFCKKVFPTLKLTEACGLRLLLLQSKPLAQTFNSISGTSCEKTDFMKRLSIIVLLLLVGCGNSTFDSKLTALLPTPVTPGSSVTAYGVFTKDAVIKVDGVLVTANPVVDGLQFTIPEIALAGDVEVVVTSDGKDLKGTVQVQPVVTQVRVEGNQLFVYGKGWSSSLESGEVVLYVSGLTVPSNLGVGVLDATVPAALSYGTLNVQVVVRNQTSAALSVTREAGTVTGHVELPAQPSAPLLSSVNVKQTSVEPIVNALLVVHEANALDDFVATHNVKIDYLAALKTSKLVFDSEVEAKAALPILQNLPGVSSVSFDVTVNTDGFAAIPVHLSEGSPSTFDVSKQWHLPLLALNDAWAVTKGAGVVVAVVDTGVDLTHPDLTANLLPGYDFIDGDDQPQDTAGHGTHVTGLVAANGVVSGTAPEAKMLPVRVLEGTSGGSAFTVAQGILWAAGLGTPANPNPAQIINLSLGSSDYSETIAAAVQQALAKGVIVVAATGNSGGAVAYPAALQGVISVTSLAGPTIAYQPWYANRGGGTWVTAYGGDTTQDQNKDGEKDGILSTDLEGEHSLRMGTSMASPQVAGLAALAVASGTPPSLVRQTLANTANDLGAKGYDFSFGYGLVTGRTATASKPRLYVVALDDSGKPIAWTLVQSDGSYILNNLPPSISVSILAASDEDDDGVVAEAGEMISNKVRRSVESGTSQTLETLILNPTEGSQQVSLEATQ
jgi:serine protease